MVIACYCGEVFSGDSDLEQCPNCGEPACCPSLSDEDVELLRADLDLMLEYPILAEESS